MARRITSMVILAAFAAIALLAFLGNPWLASAFLLVEGAVLAHHAFSLCGRCSNLACGFNPGAGRGEAPPVEPGAYSDLPITRTTVIPLLAAYPLAVVAAWQASPIGTVAVGAVGLGAHQVFRKMTCSRCGNDCVGNCNAEYRAWRSEERRRRDSEAA